ncbi:MAG: triose-phosphate isomerase [Methanobacteriota archaeon]|nr:MAG: triose-phosphate isomerase [Euryarchaeota archaeon]
MGPKALAVAKIAAEIANRTGASIVVAPAATDVARIAHEVRIPVFAQHVDAVEAGARTGWLPPEAALEAGAAGTLLNHSERKIPMKNLQAIIPRCEALGLEVVGCADDLAEAESIARLGPEYVAIEPPELIGGDVSVTRAKPEVVSGAVARIRKVNPRVEVLCGAGVRTAKDVARAIELGTVGVLLASGVVKAKDPKKALADLARGLR